MDWSLVFLIVSLAVTLLAFLWGIIKVFKKPHEDESWKQPLDILKDKTIQNSKDCQTVINQKLTVINQTLNEHGNKIHDLEKDKDVLQKSIDDLKLDTSKISSKCDTILDKVIEYMSKD